MPAASVLVVVEATLRVHHDCFVEQSAVRPPPTPPHMCVGGCTLNQLLTDFGHLSLAKFLWRCGAWILFNMLSITHQGCIDIVADENTKTVCEMSLQGGEGQILMYPIHL